MPKNLMRKTLEEYFLDETEGKSDPWREIYESLHYSPASEMEIRRQKIACLDAILDKERQRHSEKMSNFQERWELAAQAMKTVDENVVKLDDHYKDTNIQRERYIHLAQRQDELKDLKMAEIRKLTKEFGLLNEIQEQTSERLERFKPVEKYLEKVRDESQGEFKTIRDLLDRFTLLDTTRSGLMEREQHARTLVGRRTKQMASLAMLKSNEAVLLNNSIFDIREALEELTNQLQELDEDFLHIKTTAAQRAMTLGQVRIASYNLYLQVCQKLGRSAKIPANDTIKQLNYIQISMKEIAKLRREVKHMLKDAHESVELAKAEKERLALEKRKKFRDPNKKHKYGDMLGIFGFPQPEGVLDEDESLK